MADSSDTSHISYYPPQFDNEILQSIERKEFLLLLIDKSQWVKAKCGNGEDRVDFVVETHCSEDEYHRSIWLSRICRQFHTVDICGRRYQNVVDLFTNEEGQLLPGLKEQYEQRRCSVAVEPWPQYLGDSYCTMINAGIMTKIVAEIGHTLEYAIVSSMEGFNALAVVPCTAEHYGHCLYDLKYNRAAVAQKGCAGVKVVAVVRKNQITWIVELESLLRSIPSLFNAGRISFVYDDSIDNQQDSSRHLASGWNWVVPLTLPDTVAAAHNRPCKQAKTRKQKKRQALRKRQETSNLLDETATLGWLRLPGGRQLTADDLAMARNVVGSR